MSVRSKGDAGTKRDAGKAALSPTPSAGEGILSQVNALVGAGRTRSSAFEEVGRRTGRRSSAVARAYHHQLHKHDASKPAEREPRREPPSAVEAIDIPAQPSVRPPASQAPQ